MEDYQSRVVEEAKELLERSNKLADFLETDKYKDLDDEEKSLLEAQLGIMVSYYRILEIRIKKF